MDYFGLDLGTSLIKAVQLKNEKGQLVLVAAASTQTPPKGLVSEAPLDQEAVAEAVKKLLAQAKITSKKVNSALPDAQVFSRVIELPLLSEKELESALKWEAEQYIPFPMEEVNLDFVILEKNEKTKKMEVLIVAAPIRLIEKYTKILKLAGLTPISLETEIIAVSRAVSHQTSPEETVMVVNLGGSTSNFSIIKKGVFSFAGSIASGGEALTRAIGQELGVDLEQAEEYKKTYGLETERLEGKVLTAIEPVMNKVVEEIRKALSFYQEKNPSDKVNSLVITGGTARLPGLAPYLTQNLGMETQIGRIQSKIQIDPQKFTAFINNSVVYMTATGLALREN